MLYVDLCTQKVELPLQVIWLQAKSPWLYFLHKDGPVTFLAIKANWLKDSKCTHDSSVLSIGIMQAAIGCHHLVA